MREPHTQFPNDILDTLVGAGLPGIQLAIVLAIIRQTYGWNRDSWKISQRKFAESTGRSLRAIHDDLHAIQQRRIIIQTQRGSGTGPAHWRVNPQIDEWIRASVELECNAKPECSVEPECNTSVEPECNAKRPHLLKKVLKKNKGIAAKSSAADPRFKPLVDFFFEEYKKRRETKYIPLPAEFKAIKDLLRRAKNLSLDNLKAAVERFLGSSDLFHQKQGKPLLYFCNNVNAFLHNRNDAARSRNPFDNGPDYTPRDRSKDNDGRNCFSGPEYDPVALRAKALKDEQEYAEILRLRNSQERGETE
jgi:phage replication O-like protein O